MQLCLLKFFIKCIPAYNAYQLFDSKFQEEGRMNSISNLNNNLLFCLKNTQNTDEFFKYCLEYTKREKVVLLLTTDSQDVLPIIKNASLKKEELKRLVIMHLENMDEFIQKLLELHDWTWLPTLIVVDLRSIIDKVGDELNLINAVQSAIHNNTNTESTLQPMPFFSQLALLIASLLGYYESILKRLKKRVGKSQHSVPDVDTNVFTVLVLNEHSVNLTRERIELIINLYYYSNNAFDDLNELIEVITLKD